MHQELFKPNLGFLLTFHSSSYLMYYLFFGFYPFFQMTSCTSHLTPMRAITFLNLCKPAYDFILLSVFTGSLYTRHMFQADHIFLPFLLTSDFANESSDPVLKETTSDGAFNSLST